MKEGIHPKYGPAKVICACGKVWEIYSTRKEQKVGICAECHPFITGKQKLVPLISPPWTLFVILPAIVEGSSIAGEGNGFYFQLQLFDTFDY